MRKNLLLCCFVIFFTGCAATQVEKERKLDTAMDELAGCWINNFERSGFGRIDQQLAAPALAMYCEKQYNEMVFARAEARFDDEPTRKNFLRNMLNPEAHIRLFTKRAVDVRNGTNIDPPIQ